MADKPDIKEVVTGGLWVERHGLTATLILRQSSIRLNQGEVRRLLNVMEQVDTAIMGELTGDPPELNEAGISTT